MKMFCTFQIINTYFRLQIKHTIKRINTVNKNNPIRIPIKSQSVSSLSDICCAAVTSVDVTLVVDAVTSVDVTLVVDVNGVVILIVVVVAIVVVVVVVVVVVGIVLFVKTGSMIGSVNKTI